MSSSWPLILSQLTRGARRNQRQPFGMVRQIGSSDQKTKTAARSSCVRTQPSKRIQKGSLRERIAFIAYAISSFLTKVLELNTVHIWEVQKSFSLFNACLLTCSKVTKNAIIEKGQEESSGVVAKIHEFFSYLKRLRWYGNSNWKCKCWKSRLTPGWLKASIYRMWCTKS